MKPKRVSKKLNFKKVTVSRLNNVQLIGVKGGITDSINCELTYTCEDCVTYYTDCNCVDTLNTNCGTCYATCQGVSCPCNVSYDTLIIRCPDYGC